VERIEREKIKSKSLTNGAPGHRLLPFFRCLNEFVMNEATERGHSNEEVAKAPSEDVLVRPSNARYRVDHVGE
jgi:hypothetical protein